MSLCSTPERQVGSFTLRAETGHKFLDGLINPFALHWKCDLPTASQILAAGLELPPPTQILLPDGRGGSFIHSIHTSPHNHIIRGLFPDHVIFRDCPNATYSHPTSPSSSSPPNLVQNLFDRLVERGLYRDGRWTAQTACPNFSATWAASTRDAQGTECDVGDFLNNILGASLDVLGFEEPGEPGRQHGRRWKAHQSRNMTGSIESWRPDLVCTDRSPADWRSARAIIEVKSGERALLDTSFYTELAGRASTIFSVQDNRRYAVLILIHQSTFTPVVFDRGGSIRGWTLDIHTDACQLLCLIMGLCLAPLEYLGYDTTVYGEGALNRLMKTPFGDLPVQITLFISPNLHGRGTVVRLLKMSYRELRAAVENKLIQPLTGERWLPGLPEDLGGDGCFGIIAKDTWHDNGRSFTEGTILTILRDKGVRGVTRLLHEELITAPDAPIRVLDHETEPDVPPTKPDTKSATANPSIPDTSPPIPYWDSTGYIRARAGLTHYSPSAVALNVRQRNIDVVADNNTFQLRTHLRQYMYPHGLPIIEFSCAYELLTVMIDLLTTHNEAFADTLPGSSEPTKWRVLHRDPSIWNCMMVPATSSDWGLDEKYPDTRRGLLPDWGFASVQLTSSGRLDWEGEDEDSDEDSGEDEENRSAEGISDSREQYWRLQYNPPIDVAGSGDVSDVHHAYCYMHDQSKLEVTGTRPFMALELLAAGNPDRSGLEAAVANKVEHDLEGFFYALAAICVWFEKPYQTKTIGGGTFTYSWLFASDDTPDEEARRKWNHLKGGQRDQYFHDNVSPYFAPLEECLRSLAEYLLQPEWSPDYQSPPSITHEAATDILRETRSKLPALQCVAVERPSAWKDAVPNIVDNGILILPPEKADNYAFPPMVIDTSIAPSKSLSRGLMFARTAPPVSVIPRSSSAVKQEPTTATRKRYAATGPKPNKSLRANPPRNLRVVAKQ